MSRREARHRVDLLLSNEDGLLVELFFNSKVGLTLLGMVFSKFFDFLFQSWRKKSAVTSFFLVRYLRASRLQSRLRLEYVA